MRIIKPGWVHHNNEPIFSIDIHPDGSRFATSGSSSGFGSGKICVWNMEPIRSENVEKKDNVSKLLCCMEQHLGCVNCVRWSNDGVYLASGADDKFIIIWKLQDQTTNYVENWRCISTLRGHDGDVLHVAWSPKDKYLASSSVDNAVIVWNANKFPEKVATLKKHKGLVKGVCWDPQGNYIASQSDDKTLRIFSVANWTEVFTLKKPFDETSPTTHVLRLDWSPDGAYVVSAHSMNNGGPTAQIIDRNGWTTNLDFVGHRKAVTAVRFKRDKFKGDHCVLALASRDRSVSVWRTDYTRPVCVMHDLFNASVLDVSWGYGNNKELACCSSDGSVAFFTFTTDEIGKPIVKKILSVEKPIKKIEPEKIEKVRALSTSSQSCSPKKQIERHTAEGRRRITPVLLGRPGDTLTYDKPMFSSTTESSQIIVERRNSEGPRGQSSKRRCSCGDDEHLRKRPRLDSEVTHKVVVCSDKSSFLQPASLEKFDFGDWKIIESSVSIDGLFFLTKFRSEVKGLDSLLTSASKLISLKQIRDNIVCCFFLSGQCCIWDLLEESNIGLAYSFSLPVHAVEFYEKKQTLAVIDIGGNLYLMSVENRGNEIDLHFNRKIESAHIFVEKKKRCQNIELLDEGSIRLTFSDRSIYIHDSISNLWRPEVENDILSVSNKYSTFYDGRPSHMAAVSDLRRKLQYCLYKKESESYIFYFNCLITELVVEKKESVLKQYVNKNLMPFAYANYPKELRMVENLNVDKRMLLQCVLRILEEFGTMRDLYEYIKRIYDGMNYDIDMEEDVSEVEKNVKKVIQFLKNGNTSIEELRAQMVGKIQEASMETEESCDVFESYTSQPADKAEKTSGEMSVSDMETSLDKQTETVSKNETNLVKETDKSAEQEKTVIEKSIDIEKMGEDSSSEEAKTSHTTNTNTTTTTTTTASTDEEDQTVQVVLDELIKNIEERKTGDDHTYHKSALENPIVEQIILDDESESKSDSSQDILKKIIVTVEEEDETSPRIEDDIVCDEEMGEIIQTEEVENTKEMSVLCPEIESESLDMNDKDTGKSDKKQRKKYEILKEYGIALKKTIGKGSYAIVKLAFSSELNFDVAVRIVSLERAGRKVREKFLPRELDIVKILNHPNIVFYYQIIKTNLNVYVIMEYAGDINLRDELEKHKFFEEWKAGDFFIQITDGVFYLHELGVAHRDLKTENILLDERGRIKITDFGFSRFSERLLDGTYELSKTFCGSYSFAAYEILCGTPYFPLPADIWSLGVILYNMVEGHLPFEETNLHHLIKAIEKKGAVFAVDKGSKDYISVVKGMLAIKYENRDIMSLVNRMRNIVLIGDSLTQQAWNENAGGGWGAKIADYCLRNFDVLNRGLSGYNTRWVETAILEEKDSFITKSMLNNAVLVTLFFGANDASTEVQHVPLEEFKENLVKYGEYIKNHAPSATLVLLTPPPVITKLWPNRNNENALKYSKAVIEASNVLECPCLDVYSSMIKLDNWQECLYDGIHLAPKGGDIIFNLIKPILKELLKKYPNKILPDWKDFANLPLTE
ncbi:DgyrCDS5544 [Dimorphilus gyrociliatus]|uniref:DgyrCDS5544 n=1 Tax=Dimorphilus gyrociliatus TaxID=2664684 RepID=A0A7I8VK73_9ANNE|nr:DgyrCDS5544 [Dimorphilus gyrociliatus]